MVNRTRYGLEKLALKHDILNPHEKTIETLIELLLDKDLSRSNLNTIARNISIKKPKELSTSKLISIFQDFLIKKRLDLYLSNLSNKRISINELERIEMLNELSYDTLEKLAKIPKIKNYDSLTRDNLIFTLLRSKHPNEKKIIENMPNHMIQIL